MADTDGRNEAPDDPPDPLTPGVWTNPDHRITAALAAAQGDFPPIPKHHTAEVRPNSGKPGYSYSYADLADVLGAVRPVLARHGLAITQTTRHRSTDGKVMLTTTLRHVAGGTIESEVELGQSPGSPQQFGSALTYLRRYELVTLLGIAAEQDLDAADVEPAGRGGNSHAAPALPPWAEQASDARKRELVAALEPHIGRDNAVTVGRKVAESTGAGLPEVCVTTAKVIGVALLAVRRAADTGEQDRAAEQGDPTAADGPPVEGPERATAQTLRAMTYDAVQAVADDAAQPHEAREAAFAELERRRTENGSAADEPQPDTDKPGAGSIDVGKLPSDPAKAIGVLKANGCTCPDPLGLRGEEALSDTCPVKGHGIPF